MRPLLNDPVLGPLTDDALTRDVRVYQRQRGHRFSSDDLVTAYVAHQRASTAARVLDLGCGLGSVLLHLAWSMPRAHLVGIEAQEISFALLKRNVERNRLSARVTVHHGDLRDEHHIAALGADFPLITGTPPYFPPGTALDADDPQRAHARIEYRGGVEDYLKTASRLLARDGVLVLCGAAGAEPRVQKGAEALGLFINTRTEIIARAGRPALFSVWTFARAATQFRSTAFVLRDAVGATTDDARRLRSFAGLDGTG